MAKVIKQVGKDSEITLDWAADKAQQSYSHIFQCLDELDKTDVAVTREMLTDLVRQMTNTLVTTLKMATILSTEEAVLNSIFSEYEGVEVEIVEKEVANVVDADFDGEKGDLKDFVDAIENES